MSTGFYIVLDTDGNNQWSNDSKFGIEESGAPFLQVADAGVVATPVDARTGTIAISDDTTTDSDVFKIVDTAGTLTTEQLGTPNVAFNNTKDNASTINVYFETGVVNIQNLSGGIVDLTVKFYV